MVLIASLVLLSFLFSHLLQTAEAQAARKHKRCGNCHITPDPIKGAALFAEGVEPSSVCLRCHKYRENHHPVDFIPAESYYVSPGKEFPLFSGQVRCLTCHDPHPEPGYNETPKLLRGGPYADQRDICFKCHFQEKYAEIDPHIMTDPDGKIREVNGKPVCLICHSVKPNPEVDRTKDVKFRADVGFLCWRCHPPMPGEFFAKHFLVKPSKRIMRYIEQSEKELGIILPLVPRGRITCSTCHNPHQIEVMVHEPAKQGADSPKKLRIPQKARCVACHYGL